MFGDGLIVVVDDAREPSVTRHEVPLELCHRDKGLGMIAEIKNPEFHRDHRFSIGDIGRRFTNSPTSMFGRTAGPRAQTLRNMQPP